MYDILIVGAGTAGMACAIIAAQNGAKVGLIEKADYIGGALHWSGGQMSAGGTRRQKAKGIEDSPDKHFEDIVRINGSSGDLALTRLAVDEAPHTLDWLEDLGFEFAPECPRIIYGHVPYTTERTHYGVNKAMSIYKVLKPLWDEQVANGNIHLHLQHSLITLRKSGNRFDSVICLHKDEYKAIKGKSIVMTTGGYGSNPKYFEEKHPNVPLTSSCYPTATGDGHQVVEQLGGEFKYGDYHIPSLAGLEYPKGSGRCNFNQAWAMILTSVYRQPREIYVNLNGKRFMDEGEVNADTRERIVTKQPEWKFWLIFDENALLERNPDGSENPIIMNWDTERIKAETEKEESFYKADTIHELATKIGLSPNVLKDTVNRFNQQVVQGFDDDFSRNYLNNSITKAPYYAIFVHAASLATFGGMKANSELQLLDKDGNVLEGLYAAGEILGLGALSGSAFCSGMAITPALSFGRILGKKLSSKNDE